ncbi:MAG: hypothetical protein VB027_04540 [Gordonibacter sp.]|nr:hypothetical protein [Gordonibacter sp.]
MTIPPQTVVSFGLAACLLFGVLGLSGCSSTPEDAPVNEQTEQQQASDLKVELPVIDGDTLLADFAVDANFAKVSNVVAAINLSVDNEARHVELVVSAASSDTSELCAAGQAVAQCLSDHAHVSDATGAEVSDNGPCGALFEAYDLSVRVEGLTQADVFDGLLPAGGTEIMWQ